MKSLLRLWPYVRRYRWTLLFGIAAILACSVLRAIIPEYLGRAVDYVREGRMSMRELGDWALLILALAGLAGCFLFLMRRSIIDVSREIEFDFRNDFFRKLLRLDPSFYDGQQTGDLMSRATNDIEAIRQVVGPGILYLVNTLFLLPLVLWRMIGISPGLTLWAMLPLLLLPPLVQRVKRSLHDRSLEVQNQFGRLTTVAQENLAGIRVVKAYVQERSEIQKFEKENEYLIDRSLALARLQAAFFPLLRFVAGLGLVVVLLLGGKRVIDGQMMVGELIAMTILFQMLVWPLIAFGWVISVWQRGEAAMERLIHVFDADSLIPDGLPTTWVGERLEPTDVRREIERIVEGELHPASDAASTAGEERAAEPSSPESPSSSLSDHVIEQIAGDAGTPRATAAADLVSPERPSVLSSDPAMQGEVKISNLTFTYPGAAGPALFDISIQIPSGGSLGIVGPVGCGKSTLASLLCRLYPVERGTIFIDGRDLNDWPLEALRRQISLVFQEAFIFSESIAENVAFGKSEEILDPLDLSDAVMLAHLHADLEDMPDGLKTLLGERGINLSGGQKQRLALARAIVREPRILVVDDAMSAVDTHTESRILENLRSVAQDRTTFVIAHRLSALSWCDSIIVLEGGRITERGTHEELLEAKGLYADIWNKQQLEEEVQAL